MFYTMSQTVSSTDQLPFATIPERYQRILDLLDGHAKGQVDYTDIQVIDEEELRIARHLRRQQTNAWVDEHFPEVDAFDEF